MIFNLCVPCAIHLAGIVISRIGWLWLHMAFLVVLGINMNVLACVFFKVFPPKEVGRVLIRYACKRMWIFLPVPILAAVEVANFVEHFTTIRSYLIGGAVYILTAAIVTICLMRQYRK